MLEYLIDTIGDGSVLLLAGLAVGVFFGASAQHSRFCLRAAAAEVGDGEFGARFAVWLITFSAAVVSTQASIALGFLDVSNARQLAATGSISGAVIGGLMFGVGMILARGCASRLLVLSATGNLRALVTGLVLTLVAQASLRGILAPAREKLGSIWLIDGGSLRNLLNWVDLDSAGAIFISIVILAASITLAAYRGNQWTRTLAAVCVGLAVALGWVATYHISQISFEPVPISSVTFTGPATDTLMGLVNSRELTMSFGIGLVPGVFLGAAVMAFISAEFRIQRFGSEVPMERYLIGAALMGFGAMLAGGCAVGSGVSGGAILAVTAWAAVFFMWVGAIATHLVLGSGIAPFAKAQP
ncbi:YeeE/YedE family protein [Hoeflea sp. TYP-13]|uniref:YeeE/YedE family protein n=1 Tax=Hoeflea sp. TYP-13 TaxID=3230023 RepID=UPI0034C5F244